MGQAADDRRTGRRSVALTVTPTLNLNALHDLLLCAEPLVQMHHQAMANSGVARLTIGIETKAAMNRPPT